MKTAIWRYNRSQMASHAATLRIRDILGGESVLGRRVSSERDLIDAVRTGLPHAALASVMELLGLSADTVSSALSLPKRTLSRRKREARLTPEESDRLVRLARVAAAAIDLFGEAARAAAWLRKPNRALGNVAPLALMDTDIGMRQVEDLLGRIAHGVYS